VVEHLLHTQEVAGSSPAPRTIFQNWFFLFLEQRVERRQRTGGARDLNNYVAKIKSRCEYLF
jgi:hypothetical protein